MSRHRAARCRISFPTSRQLKDHLLRLETMAMGITGRQTKIRLPLMCSRVMALTAVEVDRVTVMETREMTKTMAMTTVTAINTSVP